MRIIHVITGLGKAAGTTTFIENVAAEQRKLDHDVVVATDILTVKQQLESAGFVKTIIHIHGLWSGLQHKTAGLARKAGIPFVWSTHGMTAPWSMKHKWWKKLPAWLLYQKRDLKSAALIHCTSEKEVGWNHALGFKKTFVAPLGTYLPEKMSNCKPITGNGVFIVLFVGRIYPVKGLVNLVKAVAILKSEARHASQSTLVLRVVGPDQAGHKAELISLCAHLGLKCVDETIRSAALISNAKVDVIFTGPKFGADLDSEYDGCDVLVLPSYTENFGGVVIDALAHGKPAIASRYTPWSELEREGCGWWIDNSPDELSRCLSKVRGMDVENLRKMGRVGHELVSRFYAWNIIAENIVCEYSKLI